MGRIKLFNDTDTADDISNIEVDPEFARRYKHNKEREALQRYEELKKEGLVDDDGDDGYDSTESSDSDDDDDGRANKENRENRKFFDKLLKVKNQDPCLNQNVPLFSSDSEEEEEDDEGDNEKQNGGTEKSKTMYLKDVVARNLIEEGSEFDDEEISKGKRGKTYNEELEELRKPFLDAAKDFEGEDDGEAAFLKVKDGSSGTVGNEEDDKEFESKLRKYFGEENELDERKMFLMEYFKNKMWRDKDTKSGLEHENFDELSEDEEEVEMQEDYEKSYNFRHEENVGDRVVGHSRVVEGTVRKKENPRKEQRKKKEERMKIAEMERKEELKHLKNLKKKEMEEKIRKVMKVAGIESSDCPIDLKVVDEDFDPQEYDKMMKKAFDEKYYKAKDADPEYGSDDDDDDDEDDDGDIQKPDFDKEDELLGLPKGWDTVDNVDDFLSARERILKQKSEMVNDGNNPEEEEEEDGEVEEEEEEGKRKRKRKLSLVQTTKQELLDEYYKLDYEGTIGDLKTRFKYAKVDPNKFGLKTRDILLLDDKDLNQYVSVKKLAPYRETEWKVPGNLKFQYKMKARELKRQFIRRKDGKKHEPKERKAKSNMEESTSTELSRKAKRKLNQAPLKLSQSRLSAYGKVQGGGAKTKRKL